MWGPLGFRPGCAPLGEGWPPAEARRCSPSTGLPSRLELRHVSSSPCSFPASECSGRKRPVWGPRAVDGAEGTTVSAARSFPASKSSAVQGPPQTGWLGPGQSAETWCKFPNSRACAAGALPSACRRNGDDSLPAPLTLAPQWWAGPGLEGGGGWTAALQHTV